MRCPAILAAIVSVVLTGAAIPAVSFADPNIEGTYELVSRDLPDGSKLMPPRIAGMVTYTQEYRNFNVYWQTGDGKQVSIAYVGKYRLTSTAYQETPVYWMSNNLIGTGPSYEIPSDKHNVSPVTVKDGRIEFQVPGEPPVLVFDKDTMTATAKGFSGKLLFVDHWRRVR